ncbi:S1-like domain-containing RNA-binding protein [Thalassotalea nanhaiensis]|uniref:S1-like domain-containing RNA-binding protein n=1 Tax=Thalassotalea nanhaiensis TaxID=3065648 RepID=A0ABY9TKE3_9GAMM|nr:S1-like domain-containing RNA-binding protein [Colwelliaceae bacterium SQ345]
MAEIGKINTLKVVKLTEFGAYLDGADLGEILLPTRYLPDGCAEGLDVSVFIYFDSNDRLIATTETPKGQVDDFVSLKVLQVNNTGAFLDWGLPKDLLVPYNQQHHKMVVGKYYLVKIYRDIQTDRIAASSKLDKYLDIWPANYEIGERVNLTIGDKTDLGFKAIINDRNWGLLYDNEIFQPLRVGKKILGYVKTMRSDGRVDLTLTRPGIGKVNDFAPTFIAYLQDNDGFSAINDKSSPELIQQTFGVSKKTFKSTVGNLFKHGRVSIEADGIRFVKNPQPKKPAAKVNPNKGKSTPDKTSRGKSNKSFAKKPQSSKPKTYKKQASDKANPYKNSSK